MEHLWLCGCWIRLLAIWSLNFLQQVVVYVCFHSSVRTFFVIYMDCPRSTSSRFNSWLDIVHRILSSVTVLVKHLVERHEKLSPTLCTVYPPDVLMFSFFVDYSCINLHVWLLVLSCLLNSEEWFLLFWLVLFFCYIVQKWGRNSGFANTACLL